MATAKSYCLPLELIKFDKVHDVQGCFMVLVFFCLTLADPPLTTANAFNGASAKLLRRTLFVQLGILVTFDNRWRAEHRCLVVASWSIRQVFKLHLWPHNGTHVRSLRS